MEQDIQERSKWTGGMECLRWVDRNEHPKKESGRYLYLGQRWSLKRLRRAKIRRCGVGVENWLQRECIDQVHYRCSIYSAGPKEPNSGEVQWKLQD